MLQNNDVQKLLYLAGNEGKRWPYSDVVVPRDIETPQALAQYL